MFKIEAILSDEIQNDQIKTTQALVLSISNKKELTKIISFLNVHLPLNQLSLSHLKRIDSSKSISEIVIAPIVNCSDDYQDEEGIIQKTILQFDEELKSFIQKFNLDKLKVCDVPSYAPLTRSQFSKASLLWPVNFHENKYVSSCLNATLFSAEQLARIFDLIKITIALSKSSKAHPESEYCRNNPCNPVSALIVKNDRKHLVTQAVSSTEIHPLNHAVINAINNVSEIHQKAKSNACHIDLIKEYQDDYLCTDYECFLSQEPCIMCAMALVHSRIKRVFVYCGNQCDECNDQPYTTHKLHIHTSLNHRYEVWKIFPNDINDFPNKKLKH